MSHLYSKLLLFLKWDLKVLCPKLPNLQYTTTQNRSVWLRVEPVLQPQTAPDSKLQPLCSSSRSSRNKFSHITSFCVENGSSSSSRSRSNQHLSLSTTLCCGQSAWCFLTMKEEQHPHCCRTVGTLHTSRLMRTGQRKVGLLCDPWFLSAPNQTGNTLPNQN